MRLEVLAMRSILCTNFYEDLQVGVAATAVSAGQSMSRLCSTKIAGD